jgi:hypothetical protein
MLLQREAPTAADERREELRRLEELRRHLVDHMSTVSPHSSTANNLLGQIHQRIALLDDKRVDPPPVRSRRRSHKPQAEHPEAGSP